MYTLERPAPYAVDCGCTGRGGGTSCYKHPPLGPLFALHNPSLPTPFLHALNAATSLYSTLDNLHGIPDTL